MTENENKMPHHVEVINPVKPENNLKTVEDLRLQHEQEKAKLMAELKQTVSANIELGDKLAHTEYQKEQIEMAKKAVDKAYWRERNKTEFNEIRSETEGEKLSKKAYEIILKRCREGQYNGHPCRECTASLSTNIK